jgi:hypothetical protein
VRRNLRAWSYDADDGRRLCARARFEEIMRELEEIQLKAEELMREIETQGYLFGNKKGRL